ncbi:MAG: hypothetical protein PHF33_06080 [Candidatus Delongbacteria bacterium]|nr:hypothetical protein [Candidatus Delongbacteria bacterium]MDD4205609.1 hypothetical protein [Candidatus Delongbacteria bacterium]
MKKVLLAAIVLFSMLLIAGCSKSKENKDSAQSEIIKKDISEPEKIEKVKTVNDTVESSIKGFMPEKWTIKNTYRVPDDKLDYYSKTFGGDMTMVENNFISSSEPYNHYKFQVNLFRSVSSDEAEKIFNNLVSKTTNKNKYILSGNTVYEVMANDDYIERCRTIFLPEKE